MKKISTNTIFLIDMLFESAKKVEHINLLLDYYEEFKSSSLTDGIIIDSEVFWRGANSC